MPEHVLIGESILWCGLRAPHPAANRQFTAVAVVVTGPACAARRSRPIDQVRRPHCGGLASVGRHSPLSSPVELTRVEPSLIRAFLQTAIRTPPVRIIGAFNCYSVPRLVWIAPGAISETDGLEAARRLVSHRRIVSTAIATGLNCSLTSA